MTDINNLTCTFCGESAVLIRHVDKDKERKREHLCNDCIGKEEKGEPLGMEEGASLDNI